MLAHYAEEGLRILSQKGLLELLKRSKNFVLWSVVFSEVDMFRFRTFSTHLANRIKYDAAPDPYKTITINARNVDTILSWYEDPSQLNSIKYTGLGQIKSGGWDSKKYQVDIHDSYIINGMIERFSENKDWDKTSYYETKRQKHKLSQEYRDRGFSSLEEYLRADCQKYDRLHESIQSHGYQQNHQGSCKQPGKSQPVRDQLEVLVSIDRNGKIHLFDGYHRFGIAWALDLRIPVQVAYRHKQWQKTRDRLYTSRSDRLGVTEIVSHPDLNDIPKTDQ